MYFAYFVNTIHWFDNIKSNAVIHIVIPSVYTANTKWSQIRERLPFTASNYMHSWGFLTISQKWDESLFLKSQQLFLKKYVTHTSRRTVTDSDLSVKAGFQFIWEFYSIIQQALDSQLDRLKATSVCFNHQLKVTHFCLCTNSDKTAGSHTAAQPIVSQVMKIRVLFCWFD